MLTRITVTRSNLPHYNYCGCTNISSSRRETSSTLYKTLVGAGHPHFSGIVGTKMTLLQHDVFRVEICDRAYTNLCVLVLTS